MNETLLLWLFGGAYGMIITLGAGMSLIKNQMTAVQTTQDTLIRLLGSKAAFLLHSPHSPEVDALIEKFQRGDISEAEMQEFANTLQDIEQDTNMPKTERLLASLVLLELEERNRKRPSTLTLGDLKVRHKIKHPEA